MLTNRPVCAKFYICNLYCCFQFKSFDVESKYDYVQVFDGSGTDATVLGRYTGDKKVTVPLSTSNFLLVKFKSDHSKEKPGFNAAWHAGE